MIKLHTNHGVITLKLFADKAPETVANFIQYVKDGHYDNTIFHRVISNFMIQGGGFDSDMKQKSTRETIKNEANNGLSNKKGTIAMARTMEPHSASAQFFINVKDNAFLDPTIIPPGDPVPRFEYQGQVYENTPRDKLMNATQLFGYTVFGKVVSGMDVVEKIKSSPTGPGGPFPTDVPKTPIFINSATLVK